MGCALVGLSVTALAQKPEPAPPAFEKATEGSAQAEGSATAEEPDIFDPDVGAPKQVQVQVEFVEMAHEALTKLLFLAKPKSADATELRKQVQDMVLKNEAKVLETQILIARSGHKTTAESIHEFIYPTEFQPTSMEEKAKDMLDQKRLSGFPCNPAMPTAFEARNVGSTLEVEPTIGEDGRVIDLRFVPELLWHTGNTTWHEGKDKLGNPFKVQMPDFYSLRLNTALTCLSGQYHLAGVLSPKNDKGETDMTRKVMVLVKCDILSVK